VSVLSVALVVGCGSSHPIGSGAAGAGGSAGPGGGSAGMSGAAGSGGPAGHGGAAGSGSAGMPGAAGAGPAPSCQNASACGGDIVGSWTITSTCINVPPQNEGTPDCPGITGRSDGFAAVGSVTYEPNGTYTSSGTLTGRVLVDYPTSCLTSAGITCAELSAALADPSVLGSATFSAAACAPSSNACTCTLTLAPQTTNETGTYSTSGGVLSETPDSTGVTDQTDYCVQGSTLTESPHAGSTMIAGGMDVTGTIVLKKN
jgi:hypothetical protein